LRLNTVYIYLFMYLHKNNSSYRDVRGFAIKFYSDEGIWDLVGINTPTFFISDAINFPFLIHSTKRNPVTNIKVRITLEWQLQDNHFLRQTFIECPFLLFSVHRVRNDDYYYKPIYC
jgi:hypothetical protein